MNNKGKNDDEKPHFSNPLKKNLNKRLDNFDEMVHRVNSDAYDIRTAAINDMFIDEVLRAKIDKYRLQREQIFSNSIEIEGLIAKLEQK